MTATPITDIDAFKARTLLKVSSVVCPDHRQVPRVHFEGSTLRTVSIRMSGCCSKLIDLANRTIAGRVSV